MKIYNTTTEKEVSLEIIDRKTGCEWTSDLIGNAGALNYNSTREIVEMSQEDIEWWQSTIRGLEKIEDMKEEAKDLLSEEDFEALEERLTEEGNADDYEYHIAKLTSVLAEAIDRAKNPKVTITAKAPTVYQINSLSAFRMPSKKNLDGSYSASEEFESEEEAKQYLRNRAREYNDADPEGSDERLAEMMADIDNGSLRLDAVSAYINTVE